MTDGRSPVASVIIPTRNRHALLSDTLRSVMAQEFQRPLFEVVVVDDGSDLPVSVPAQVRLLRHDEPRGSNAARNTGALAATGNLFCDLDDDVDVPPGWLAAIVDGASRHTDAYAFTGRVVLRLDGGGPRFCDELPLVAQGESELDFGDEEQVAQYACGANLAIRRSALEKFGGFREDHPLYYDETEWTDRLMRAGSDIVYLPDAIVWHRRTGKDLLLRARLRRAFYRGYGEAFNRAAAGVPFTRPELARRVAGIPGLLSHSVRHRCTFGICASGNELGKLWWTVAGRKPGPGRRSR